MKINHISYSNNDTNLIDRLLEHIIEISIIEQLDCSNTDRLKLRTFKYFSENEINNLNLSEEDFSYVKSMYRILPSEHKQSGHSYAGSNGDVFST